MKRSLFKKLLPVILVLLLGLVFALNPSISQAIAKILGLKNTDTPPPDKELGDISVHYIDVGQGDAELIITSDGKTMLIDAGISKSKYLLVEYIEYYDIDVIDYFVLTHPHADHIGGAPEIFDSFDVQNVIMPDITANTNIFYETMQKIDKEECNVIIAEHGKEYALGQTEFTILGPVKKYSNDLNGMSIVLRLDYGSTSFMFTGDAEKKSESDMMAAFPAECFTADVLKAGHHGSSTSSSLAWLRAVSPKYAIISCGEGNSYGHPHQEILSRFDSLGIKYCRTDLLGSIVFKSDGKDVFLISPSGVLQ